MRKCLVGALLTCSLWGLLPAGSSPVSPVSQAIALGASPASPKEEPDPRPPEEHNEVPITPPSRPATAGEGSSEQEAGPVRTTVRYGPPYLASRTEVYCENDLTGQGIRPLAPRNCEGSATADESTGALSVSVTLTSPQRGVWSAQQDAVMSWAGSYVVADVDLEGMGDEVTVEVAVHVAQAHSSVSRNERPTMSYNWTALRLSTEGCDCWSYSQNSAITTSYSEYSGVPGSVMDVERKITFTLRRHDPAQTRIRLVLGFMAQSYEATYGEFGTVEASGGISGTVKSVVVSG